MFNVKAVVHKEEKWFVISGSMQKEHAGGLLSLVCRTVENDGNYTSKLKQLFQYKILGLLGQLFSI